ncbi:MAG: hypothetical protein KY452_03075 [Actinobacteria bacterium]|nr:hypothetical protein [Actinomycetota bacterium]
MADAALIDSERHGARGNLWPDAGASPGTGGQEMEFGRARRWRGPVPGRWSVVATGVAVVLSVGACGGGSEGSSAAPAAGKTQAPSTTTTVVPVTETAPRTNTLASTTTTVQGTETTTPDRHPVYDVNGIPQVTASPPQGGVGATIHVDGYGFTEEHWMGTDLTLWLSGPGGDPDCVVYAEAEHTVRVTPDGRLHGDFLVPSHGGCRQSGVSEFPLRPGTYAIVYQCTVCTIGTFELTGSAPPPSAECTTVGFTPQTEDAASSIVATGLSCEEAEAFVRRLGPSVSPGGPARIELEGFECVLTRYEREPLPQGFYECTSGSKRISFVRS